MWVCVSLVRFVKLEMQRVLQRALLHRCDEKPILVLVGPSNRKRSTLFLEATKREAGRLIVAKKHCTGKILGLGSSHSLLARIFVIQYSIIKPFVNAHRLVNFHHSSQRQTADHQMVIFHLF